MPTERTTLAVALLLAMSCPSAALAQASVEAEAAPAADAQPESQQEDQDLPGGFEVLDRSIEVSGGMEAGMAMQSVRMTGTFSMPAMGMTGEVAISAAAPNKQLVEITMPGFGTIVQGTNGEQAWASQPGQEPQVVEGPQADAIKSGSEFHGRYKPRERYSSAKTVGVDTVEGNDYYRIELVGTDGQESVALYSVETGLQYKEMTRATPGAESFIQTTTMLDYRESGKLKFPGKMIIEAQGMTQELTFDSIETDVEFEAGTFDAPGDL